MKTLTAKDADFGFGRMIDLTRDIPVAVEEDERSKALDALVPASTGKRMAST